MNNEVFRSLSKRYHIFFILLFLIIGSILMPYRIKAANNTLQAPKLLSAVSKGYNTTAVRWEKVPEADSYNVYYKESKEKEWKLLVSNFTKTVYKHVSTSQFPLVTGTEYLYTVQAVRNGKVGKLNKTGVAVVPMVSVVHLDQVSYPSYGSQKITWNKVDGASGYVIFRKEKGKYVRIGKAGKNATYYMYSTSERFPIEDGVTCTYTVRAYRTVKGMKYFGEYSKKGIQGTAPKKEDPILKEGWVKKDGESYYRKEGVLVSGWVKISGNTYYFSPKTKKLLKNTIAGNSESGFYYVDDNGIRVTDPVIRKAVDFVLANTNSAQTQKKKLKVCYEYIVKNYSYERFYDKEDITKMPDYAKYVFENHKGNCYRGAAALTYIAKVLGYNTRVGIGGVTAYANHNLSPHGWNEVKVDGDWYTSDISMQRSHPGVKLFYVKRKDYPYHLRYDKGYHLKVVNGEVVWIKK